MVVGGSAGVGGLFFFPKYPSGGSKVADSSPGIHLRKQGLPQDGTMRKGLGFDSGLHPLEKYRALFRVFCDQHLGRPNVFSGFRSQPEKSKKHWK